MRHWHSVGVMVVHRLRRWPNIKPTFVQCLVFAVCLFLSLILVSLICIWHCCPANVRQRTNIGSMLVQRLRRWPNIKPTLVQCVVFAGCLFLYLKLLSLICLWYYCLWLYMLGACVPRAKQDKHSRREHDDEHPKEEDPVQDSSHHAPFLDDILLALCHGLLLWHPADRRVPSSTCTHRIVNSLVGGV